jgi:phosphatidylserine/phosphatidylglycerophosphate/cardiolipin synthase-like enzyme
MRFILVLIFGAALAFGAGAAETKVPTVPEIEVGISPEGSAEVLVLRVIASAHSTIRMAAYSFTAAPVVKALIDAKKRGVVIGLVADYKHNLADDKSGKARAALSGLVTAGVNVRVSTAYQISHDKYIIVDGLHVETGSYNYSDAAARRNSENVIVLWNHPAVAATYLKQWESRWESAGEFRPVY